MTDLDELRELARGSRATDRDRAYVDARLRMEWARADDPARRAALAALHELVIEAARRSHEETRARIADGTLRGRALRDRFERVPPLERDHVVEEILGIAYPPLGEPELGPELTAYTPAGYDEIVHALDVTGLGGGGDGGSLLDVGSGMGKAVLLATLLTGAPCVGLELTRGLHDAAARAARELRAGGARFEHGDARTAPLPLADVVFMYLPFTGSALEAVLDRLGAPRLEAHRADRPFFLCAGALDTSRRPELVPAGTSRSWLHVYAWRGSPFGPLRRRA